jgi:hypothetical protein
MISSETFIISNARFFLPQERTVTWHFVAFKVFFDLWQLLTLTINPQYGWTINGDSE